MLGVGINFMEGLPPNSEKRLMAIGILSLKSSSLEGWRREAIKRKDAAAAFFMRTRSA